MAKRLLLLLTLLLATTVSLWAQYDPSFSHYWAMETSFNPAAVGKTQNMNVSAAYNMTMAGFKRNPKTVYVGGDMPLYALGGSHGVGLQMLNDAIGLFSHQKLGLQYAYKHKLLGGVVSTGVGIGLLSEKLDGSELETYFWKILPSFSAEPTTIRSVSGWNSTRREVMVEAVQSSALTTPMLEKPTLKMPISARRIF